MKKLLESKTKLQYDIEGLLKQFCTDNELDINKLTPDLRINMDYDWTGEDNTVSKFKGVCVQIYVS